MCGCGMLEAWRDSSRNRSRYSVAWARRALRTFTATRKPCSRSSAEYTDPMPPLPTSSPSRKRPPRTVPLSTALATRPSYDANCALSLRDADLHAPVQGAALGIVPAVTGVVRDGIGLATARCDDLWRAGSEPRDQRAAHRLRAAPGEHQVVRR